MASYSQTGIYSLYHHIDFYCVSCSQTHWSSLGNPRQILLCSHTNSMVLDEGINHEHDSVTSRLGLITLSFVSVMLCEIIPRQVFTACFTSMVSTVFVVFRRVGCLRVTGVEQRSVQSCRRLRCSHTYTVYHSPQIYFQIMELNMCIG